MLGNLLVGSSSINSFQYPGCFQQSKLAKVANTDLPNPHTPSPPPPFACPPHIWCFNTVSVLQARLMQAAPLQSPPSTGLRHYSAASKHVSDGWDDDDSDSRVLEWAETCSQGTQTLSTWCIKCSSMTRLPASKQANEWEYPHLVAGSTIVCFDQVCICKHNHKIDQLQT